MTTDQIAINEVYCGGPGGGESRRVLNIAGNRFTPADKRKVTYRASGFSGPAEKLATLSDFAAWAVDLKPGVGATKVQLAGSAGGAGRKAGAPRPLRG